MTLGKLDKNSQKVPDFSPSQEDSQISPESSLVQKACPAALISTHGPPEARLSQCESRLQFSSEGHCRMRALVVGCSSGLQGPIGVL